MIALAVMAAAVPIAGAQTPKDSAAAKVVGPALDSVLAHDRRYCKTNKPTSYVCADTTRVKASRDAITSLIATAAPPPTPVPIPTPPPSTDPLAEAVFDSTKATMLYQQTFDAYTLDSLRPPCGTAPPRIIDHAVPYCTAGAGWTYDANVTLGTGRSGQAAQWHYDGVYQEIHGVFLPDGAVKPTGKSTVVVQYWAKFTPDTAGQFQRTDANGNPNAMFQIKNIMLWHTANGDNNRFQIMTHMHGACPKYGPAYTMLGVVDMGGADGDLGCTSDQPVGPFLNSFANAQWHRWTIMFRPNTSQGSRDGLARLWIDGALVIRMDRQACVADVTAEVSQPIAGGWKAWCDLAELDALYSGANGISGIQWGANRTDAPTPGMNVGMPFTMAIDDVRWWVLK